MEELTRDAHTGRTELDGHAGRGPDHLVHVRKDGSRHVGPGAKKYPTLKMTADVSQYLPGVQDRTQVPELAAFKAAG